ncbi:MAG: hypothetical protein J6J00_00885 [Treponema sp.]|nr:hypothetical protein [Treponema sp.]
MGIFVNLHVSKSVTKEEWASVYSESLEMIKKLPLAEWQNKKSIDGMEITCLVRTKEHEFSYGWNNEIKKIGWETSGDYETLKTAEWHFFPKDLVTEYNEAAGDAILASLPQCTNHDWEDDICSQTYDIFGNKTQGEPYHMYLLAVCCMVESRLKDKAFVDGDITKGQLKKAVEIANSILKTPIDIPARCETNRLYERISKLNIPENEKITVFDYLYLGNENIEYGDFIRNHFSEQVWRNYLKETLNQYHVDTIGFSGKLEKFLEQGFDLRTICSMIDFQKNQKDDEDNCYESFIRDVLDTKIYLKEKNTEDWLDIDQDEERPYSVYTYFAQVVFAGAKNHKVNAYLPIEEVRKILKEELVGYSDTDKVIDDYLNEEKKKGPDEKDNSEMLTEMLNNKNDEIAKNEKEFDIPSSDYLLFYSKENTIETKLQKNMIEYFKFMETTLKEERFAELMKKTSKDRCQFLVEQNRSLLIRDSDWRKIFKDIKTNDDSFKRYYPMVRVSITSDSVGAVVRALIINDDLYDFVYENSHKAIK